MNINNLKVELDVRLDGKNKIYYIGRLKYPGRIDLSNGTTFLVFLSDSGGEELQIACNDKQNTTFNKYTKKNNKIKVSIDTRRDSTPLKSIFYVAKLNYNGYIDCSRTETVFMVFTSKEGLEELQITGDIVDYKNDQNEKQKSPDGPRVEVIYK